MLIYEGVAAARTGSPREIIKQAYRYYDCIDESVWLAMLSERNHRAHIYDGNAANELVKNILESYIPEFVKLEESIAVRYGETADVAQDTKTPR